MLQVCHHNDNDLERLVRGSEQGIHHEIARLVWHLTYRISDM